MRLLDASPRKVLLSLSLAFASLAGIHCSHPNQTPIQLDRATRSASLHIRSAHVTDQERLQIRGTIFSHTTTEVGRFKGGLVQIRKRQPSTCTACGIASRTRKDFLSSPDSR